MDFPVKAKRIWGADPCVNSFYMFRREFELADFKTAYLNISTGHYYALYINGQHVTRLYHRYFDFQKQYQEIDLTPYLCSQGSNTIAILCFGQSGQTGLMAELVVDNNIWVFTDPSWRYKQCTAYNNRAPGHCLLFGIEEQYDAREEDIDWFNASFDDKDWSFCEEDSSDNNWKNFNKSLTCDLTYDPILGESLIAAELAKSREGKRYHLTKDVGGIGIYTSVISCREETTLSLFANKQVAAISIDGEAVKLAEEIPLASGEHLLTLSCFTTLEFLIESKQDIKLSGKELSGTDAEWAVMVISSKYIKYPWHEAPGDIIQDTPEIDEAHQKITAKELKEKFPEGFTEVKLGPDSVLFRVTSQAYFMPEDGFLDPRIKKVQAFSNTQAKLNITHIENLLHDNNEPCLIEGTEGFDVNFIVDLGREYIGYVDFAVEAAEGTILDIQCFELIDDTGCFYMANHNGFAYTCREGYQHFTSNYRRGCRYLSVTIRNITAPIKFYSLSLLHNAAPVERVGSFFCDDALLNKVYEMSRDTAELCMLDTYVDCPGHEQNFWVGDARVTAMANLINFGKYDFNQHCIRMVGQSLSRDYIETNFADNEDFKANKFLSMAAFQAYPPASSLPMWSYLWVLQCHDHYVYGGNLDDLKENYDYVKRNLENSILLTGERGLLDYYGAYNLIEWAANDLSPYGEVTANSIFLAKSFEVAVEMAEVLGKKEDAAQYHELAEETRDAINKYCWDEKRQAYVDTVRDEVSYKTHLRFCEEEKKEALSYEDYLSLSRVSEQTNTLAILYDIVPEDRLKKILPILTRIKNGNYIMSSPAGRSVGHPKDGELIDNIVAVGSPFFLFFSIDALFKTGHGDIAMEVMRRDWGDMLKHGTNTCWETFKMKDHYTRSIAHAWGASPAIYLQNQVLGVKPLKPGYKEFTISPCAFDFGYARGAVATPYGPIYISWEKDEKGELNIQFDAPDACSYIK